MAKNKNLLSHDDYISRVITAYGDMIQEKIDQNWEAYILSIMFKEIRGPKSAVLSAMNWNVHVAYGKLLTRIVRNPKSPSRATSLPVWIVLPDYPVPKRAKKGMQDVALNDGLHGGGIAMIPPRSRLDCRLDGHLFNHQHLYTGRGSQIRRIVAEPITETPRKATEYTFKALERGTVHFDDIWVFPLSWDELSTKAA